MLVFVDAMEGSAKLVGALHSLVAVMSWGQTIHCQWLKQGKENSCVKIHVFVRQRRSDRQRRRNDKHAFKKRKRGSGPCVVGLAIVELPSDSLTWKWKTTCL